MVLTIIPNPQTVRQLAQLKSEENNIKIEMGASADKEKALTKKAQELSEDLKVLQESNGTEDVQSKQVMIVDVNRLIALEKLRRLSIELALSKNQKQQSEAEAALYTVNQRVEARVTVASDGKITLDGVGDFAAAGLTPAQLESAIGRNSTVLREKPAK